MSSAPPYSWRTYSSPQEKSGGGLKRNLPLVCLVSQGRLSQLELHPASMRTDQLLVLLASLNLELVVQEKRPPDPLGPNDW